MATGNEMTIESVKLVEDIIGELRGFDETPPPKRVWLDIANRLEKALGDRAGDDFGEMLSRLKSFQWKETMFLDLQTYGAGDGIYILRCKHGEPNEHYCIIKALNEDEAISRAVFDLHKPSEQVGNVGKLRNILSRVHDWLGVLIRDGRPDDRCSQCIGASDLADDVYDAMNSRIRNCDRFSDETDAMVAFLNEVCLISVDNLKEDPFDEWTPEMKARYAKWLMEFKKEEKEKE